MNNMKRNACQKCVFAVRDDNPHCGLRGFTTSFNVEWCESENDKAPNGYELQEDGYFSWVKKKNKYPKTYEECCTVLRFHYDHYLTYDDEKDINPTKEEEEFIDLMDVFSRLIVCRNAYWKIAGEESGLGKPWEPDYKNPDIDLYVIINSYNRVEKEKYGYGFPHCVFTFPTAEMRDAFKENFDPDLEICKELL